MLIAKLRPFLQPLLLAYVFLLPLRRLLYLPVVNAKIQPTELVFLFLGPLALVVWGASLWRGATASASLPAGSPPGERVKSPCGRLLSLVRDYLGPGTDHFTGWLLGYLLLLTAATLLAGDLGGYLELAGRWYLLLLFLVVVAYVREQGAAGLALLLRAWTLGVVVMGALAYLGYGLALGGVITRLVVVYENYPYFGTVYRASGVCGGPTALVLLSILPLTYAWRRWRTGQGSPWLLLFFAPILLLTFSKEVVLLALALLVVDDWWQDRKWLRPLAILTVALVYWLGTHYLLQPAQAFAGSYLDGEEFTSGKVVWQGDAWQVLETSYTAIKKAALAIAAEHPWLGVGADQFPEYLPAAKAAGIYPAHLPDYIPHSTWFGALVEAGVPGLLAVIGMAVSFRRQLVRLPATDLNRCLTAFFVVLAIGAMSMDLLHLRFLWVPAGMVLGHHNSPARAAA